jgi:hypothetical protein
LAALTASGSWFQLLTTGTLRLKNSRLNSCSPRLGAKFRVPAAWRVWRPLAARWNHCSLNSRSLSLRILCVKTMSASKRRSSRLWFLYAVTLCNGTGSYGSQLFSFSTRIYPPPLPVKNTGKNTFLAKIQSPAYGHCGAVHGQMALRRVAGNHWGHHTPHIEAQGNDVLGQAVPAI